MLKSSIAFAVFLLRGIYTKSLHAQAFSSYHGLETSIGQMHSGKNVRLGYVRGNQRVQFSIGTKIHINNPDVQDSRGFAFQYRFHAYNPVQHFGAYTNLGFRLYQAPSQRWDIRILLDVEYGKLGVISEYFYPALVNPNINLPPYLKDSLGYTLFNGYETLWNPIHHLQSSIAFSFINEVSSTVYIEIAAGVGSSFVLVEPHTYIDRINEIEFTMFRTFHWEPFNPYLRLGFNVVFPTKKAQNETGT